MQNQNSIVGFFLYSYKESNYNVERWKESFTKRLTFVLVLIEHVTDLAFPLKSVSHYPFGRRKHQYVQRNMKPLLNLHFRLLARKFSILLSFGIDSNCHLGFS